MILRGELMKRFVAGADRAQSTLLPESLDDWVDENNPVRVIDAFVDALNIAELGFEGSSRRRMFSGNSSAGTWLGASRNEAQTKLMKYTSSARAKYFGLFSILPE